MPASWNPPLHEHPGSIAVPAPWFQRRHRSRLAGNGCNVVGSDTLSALCRQDPRASPIARRRPSLFVHYWRVSPNCVAEGNASRAKVLAQRLLYPFPDNRFTDTGVGIKQEDSARQPGAAPCVAV